MICAHLSGGLGNQFFQYAAARRLAYSLKVELVLDLSYFKYTPRRDTPREFELHRYPIKARLASCREEMWARLSWGRLYRLLPFPRPWYVYKEKSHVIDEEILSLPDNVFLDGYWQSETYFKDIADIIKEELQPISRMSHEDHRIATLMNEVNAVFLHLRRCDYVENSKSNAMHGVCSNSYYTEAVHVISQLVDNPVFFIFSDDMNWVINNFNLDFPHYYVAHNSQKTAYQDLRLMSLCKHGIIANSSFSWWAAWLCRNDEKVVVAPKKWFNLGRQPEGLIPKKWIKV